MINRDLISLLGDRRKNLYYLVFVKVAVLIFNLLVFFCLSLIFNFFLSQSNNMTNFIKYGVSALALVLIKLVGLYISSKLGGALSKNARIDLREQIYHKILRLDLRATNNTPISGLVQLSIDGIEQLDSYYSLYLPQFFYSLIAPTILFIVTSLIDIQIALIMLACVPVIPLSIMLVSRIAKKIFFKYWDLYISMGGEYFDKINGLKELIVFSADEKVQNDMDENADKFRKITMRVLIMQLASITILDLVAYGGTGLGIYLCFKKVLSGNFYKGANYEWLALFLVLILLEFFLPLRTLGSAFHIAMNGVGAASKLNKFLQEEEIEWGNEELANIDDIQIKDLNFSYTDKSFLNGINIEVPKGEIIGLAGESGSGKSTIAKLLLGKYLNFSGDILINGKAIDSYKKECIYSKIGYIGADSYLFATTVRENFKIANQNISDEEIYGILDKVKLRDFISKAGGLDFKIQPEASNISGGQKQRLLLAVAMAANKDFYIFDEITSNVDSDTEVVIMDSVYDLAKEKGVVLISHRLKNLVGADKIYFLNKGVVVEEGTHTSLIEENKGYAKLFFMQDDLANGYMELLCKGHE